MIDKINETINNYGMLSGTKRILVGFSGGADSVSLLHFLHCNAGKKNIEITAVHVNHGLRGEEALRDECFARNFCKDFGIDIIVQKIDVKSIAQTLKMSTEEAGRTGRYAVFGELSKKYDAKTATAHTLSDSAETVIMNLARGAVLKGLRGIPPVRGNVIRPLINVTRAEVECYCALNNLNFVSDSSNSDKSYTRNKIRLDIIPILKSLNPNFENSIGNTITSLSNDYVYLEAHARRALQKIENNGSYCINKLINLPPAIKSRVISDIIKNFTGKSCDNKHIKLVNDVINGSSGAAALKGRALAVNKNGRLILQQSDKRDIIKWEHKFSSINILTEIKTTIIIETVPIIEYNKLKFNNYINSIGILDFEKVPQGSVFRNRRPGDKFSLPYRNVTKSLKKLFNESGTAVSVRETVPLLAYNNDVIWIEGIGVSKNYMVSSQTNLVTIMFKE